MNKTIFLAASLLSLNLAIAGPIKEVRTTREARAHLGLENGSIGLLTGQEALMRKLNTDLDVIDRDKKIRYVPTKRMGDTEKTVVHSALNIMANDAPKDVPNIDGLADAIANRSDLLVTVTLLIAKGRTDLLQIIAIQSGRNSVDLAAIDKLVELSTNESGSVDPKMKVIADNVLRDLAGGAKESILTLLKKNGFKGSKKLEDFIIC